MAAGDGKGMTEQAISPVEKNRWGGKNKQSKTVHFDNRICIKVPRNMQAAFISGV